MEDVVVGWSVGLGAIRYVHIVSLLGVSFRQGWCHTLSEPVLCSCALFAREASPIAGPTRTAVEENSPRQGNLRGAPDGIRL
jgi:hypothetical protein